MYGALEPEHCPLSWHPPDLIRAYCRNPEKRNNAQAGKGRVVAGTRNSFQMFFWFQGRVEYAVQAKLMGHRTWGHAKSGKTGVCVCGGGGGVAQVSGCCCSGSFPPFTVARTLPTCPPYCSTHCHVPLQKPRWHSASTSSLWNWGCNQE